MVTNWIYVVLSFISESAISAEEIGDGQIINRLSRLEGRLVKQDDALKNQNRRIQYLENRLEMERSKNIDQTVKFESIIERLNKLLIDQNNAIDELKKIHGSKLNTLDDNQHQLQNELFQTVAKVSDLQKILLKESNNNNETLIDPESKMAEDDKRSVGIEKERRLLLPATTITAAPVQPIAFYAYMSKPEPNPSLHHILFYDVVKTNVGGGYNSFSGIFTVPVDGVYVFLYSVRANCNGYAAVEIVKNADVEGIILADTGVTCENAYSTGNVVTSAVKGDLVFVRTHSSTLSIGNGIYSNTNGYPIFSGWLLR